MIALVEEVVNADGEFEREAGHDPPSSGTQIGSKVRGIDEVADRLVTAHAGTVEVIGEVVSDPAQVNGGEEASGERATACRTAYRVAVGTGWGLIVGQACE